jgi:hypothetical protein
VKAAILVVFGAPLVVEEVEFLPSVDELEVGQRVVVPGTSGELVTTSGGGGTYAEQMLVTKKVGLPGIRSCQNGRVRMTLAASEERRDLSGVLVMNGA